MEAPTVLYQRCRGTENIGNTVRGIAKDFIFFAKISSLSITVRETK